MAKSIINREEMYNAVLDIGAPEPIQLADYATTGLVGVAVGPRGQGKTNAGLLIGEQLAEQGWVSVFVDPAERELESLYGKALADTEAFRRALTQRTQRIVVISANTPEEFMQYGQVLLEVSDEIRKPVYVFVDEGQLFSKPNRRRRKVTQQDFKRDSVAAVESAASDVIVDIVERGRKRAIDVFITAHGFSASLNRSVFTNKNLTLIGRQEDPAAWPPLAPMFRGSKIGFSDLNALAPGEFFCVSRRGIEKVRMSMARELAKVALPARVPAREDCQFQYASTAPSIPSA